MDAPRHTLRAALAAGLLFGAAAGAASGGAAAGPQNADVSQDPFASLVSTPDAAPREDRGRLGDAPALYIADEGAARLVFDAAGGIAFARFHCARSQPATGCAGRASGWSDEVITLVGKRGARADMVYSTPDGEVAVRVAGGGAATIYVDGAKPGGEPLFRLRGVAAEAIAAQAPLALRPAGAADALLAASLSTSRVSERLGETFAFEIGAPLAEGDHAVLADAVRVAAIGVMRAAEDDARAEAIAARFDGLRFADADAPGVAADGRWLRIDYDPTAGLAGRPTSARVLAALANALR